MKKLGIILITLLTTLLLGCNNSNTTDNKKTIVTSFPPIYSHLSNISTENENVVNLVEAGQSVHIWQAKPADMINLEKADLIFINGVDLEEFMEDVIANNPEMKERIVDTSTNVKFEMGNVELYEHNDTHENEETTQNSTPNTQHNEEVHNHDGEDPHIWLSITNAKVQVENIKNALIELNPENKEIYESNTKEYITKLDNLDKEIRNRFATIEKQNFILFHDAFNYYLEEYDLDQYKVAVIQDFPGKDPGAEDIRQLIELVKDKNVKIIFTEPQFSPKIVQVLEDELGVKTYEIDPIGLELSSDGYINNMKNITNQFISAFEENE